MKAMLPMALACGLLAACGNQDATNTADRLDRIGDQVAARSEGLTAGIDRVANAHGEAVEALNSAAGAAVDAVTRPADAWVGKWVGVEGLALDIAAGAKPGDYDLRVALMDGTRRYIGTADGEVIRFTRDGRQETIRHVAGNETGLKWLAGKQDCLMIKPGEGFCRG